MAAATRPLFYNGPKGDDSSYNLKDPKQFAAWEASWASYLGTTAPEAIERTTNRGGKAATPRVDLTLDNDDLNYEAWLTFVNEQVDEDEVAAQAFRSFKQGTPAFLPRFSPARKPVTEDGMYRMADGTIAKVQYAVNGSGNLYAKRLVISEDHGSFEYAPGLIRQLSADDRMTVEEAAEFGRLYGWCCVCGRTLTDEKSIAAGIGPVCAGRM